MTLHRRLDTLLDSLEKQPALLFSGKDRVLHSFADTKL